MSGNETLTNLAKALRERHGVAHPSETFSRLQDEIIALSVFASAAYRADWAERLGVELDRSGERALMGHEWEPLAAAIMPRIARLADDLTFVLIALQEGDADDADEAEIQPLRQRA